MSRLNLILMVLILAIGQNSFGADGKLQVINISADTSMMEVEVSLQGSTIIDTLSYNEASEFLTVTAGLGQTLTFTSLKYPSQTFELTNIDIDSAGHHQSILYGVVDPSGYAANPEGITLDINATYVNVDTTNIATNDVRVNFFHGVGDAVELDVADLSEEYIVDDMSYGEYSANSVDLEIAQRELFFTSTDSSTTIASKSIDLAAISGKTLTILLSGFIIPTNNNDGPVINYTAFDEIGNAFDLEVVVPSSVLNELLIDLNFYPNPSNGQATITFNNESLKELSISLLDLSGRVLSQQIEALIIGNNRIDIFFPSIANGTYILGLESASNYYAIPVVIAK